MIVKLVEERKLKAGLGVMVEVEVGPRWRWGQVQGDPEHGITERNKETSLKISKMSEMSIALTAQTTAAVIGFHLIHPSSSTKVLLFVVLVD